MRSRNTPSSILAMAVFAAFAAPVSATVVTQSLGATSQSTANGVSGTASANTFPGYINSSNNANDLLGSGQGFAFANQNGAYAVSSYSAGIGSGQGNASLRYSIFNDSGFAQNLSMAFKIYGGSISTNLVPAQSLTGAESLSSSYAASIKVNGISVAAGTPSGPIALNVGTNVITTAVVSQDLTTTNTYTLSVTRVAPGSRWWDGGTTDIPGNGNAASAGGTGTWEIGRAHV